MYDSNTTTGPSDSYDLPPYVFVSDEATLIFRWINHAVLCQVIDVFGVVSNIINIVCFVKQGFGDPVNVSLLGKIELFEYIDVFFVKGLAISDLGCLLTLIWLNITLTPVFLLCDLPFDAVEVNYLTAGWPHVVFSRVTSCITALITLERCLCITVPLKVKNMITSKRVLTIISSVFMILICSETPVYCVNGLGLKFYSDRNKTLIGLVSTEGRHIVEKVTYPINNIFLPVAAFVTVSVSTIILVNELRKKAAWRKSVTSVVTTTAVSSRDQKIAKMIVMISTLFIVCFIPVVMNFVAMTLVPEFSIDGKYRHLFMMLFGLCFTLESTNSSMNIFIYYSMSSRYKAVFKQLFRPLSAEKQRK